MFIDESGFMLQPLVRRTWAPVGQTPVLEQWDRRDRISVITALALSPGRRWPTSKKYTQGGTLRFAGIDFAGDQRDQRSQLAWLRLWLAECRRLLAPRAYAMVFSDWRQLPLTTDAVQAAGLLWQGIIAWDKGLSARAPHRGYFRHQCEYVTWATNGDSPKSEHGGPWPGCVRHTISPQRKNHPCAKPIGLMIDLLGPVTPSGLVLDPFAGGGATLAAAAATGRRAVGVELSPEFCEAAAEAIEAAA